MSDFTLNVTASEPFADNAPITRAMLRNASVPIVTATGSVGSEFIQSGAITNAKVSATASEAIAHTKIAVPEGSLVIGGTNNIGSELEPTSNLAGNGVDGNVKLLADTGTKYEALVTSLSSTGGHVGVQKHTENNVNTLKLVLNTGVITGAHVSTTGFYDGNSITKNQSSGKLEIADGGVHHQKLYAYKDSNGDPKSGFLTYGSGGAAYIVQASAANQIAVTSAANGNPELRTFDKEVDLSHFTVGSDNHQWKRVPHGLTNASGSSGVCPTSVSFYLECTNHDDAHGYAVGDRIYEPKDRGGDPNNGFNVTADKTYVIAHVQAGGHIQLPKKCGGTANVLDTDGNPTGNTHTGTSGTTFVFATHMDDFKVVVRVCG